MRIGLISDTHGLLRAEAKAFLQGCDHIVHAGDICDASILEELACLEVEPSAAGIHVVVSGHSHRPLIERRDGVLFVNPGSAGPRRFKLPFAVAELTVDGAIVSARVMELKAPDNSLERRRDR